MEVLRESLAISLFVLALPYLKKGAIFKYYFIAVFACLFHYSSILILILPIFWNKSLRTTLILCFCGIISMIFLDKIAHSILPFLNTDSSIGKRFEIYSAFSPSVLGFSYHLIIYFLFPLFIYRQNKRYRLNIDFSGLAVIYFILAFAVSYFTGMIRFINYFIPVMIVVFSTYLNKTIFLYRIPKQIKYALVVFFFTAAITPITFYYLRDTSYLVKNTHSYDRWLPYTSVFNKTENPIRTQLWLEGFEYSKDVAPD